MGQIRCPSCQNSVGFFDSERGRAVVCKSCHNQIQIPVAESSPTVASPGVELNTAAIDKPTTLTESDVEKLLGRPTSRPRRGRELLLWASVIIALIGCAAVLVYLYTREEIKPLILDTTKLGDETHVAGYRVRPPLGYLPVASPPNAPPGRKFFYWRGRQRADGTAPFFAMMVGTRPANERSSLEEGLTELLQTKQSSLDGWSHAKFQKFNIGGLTFLQSRWSGVDKRSGRRMNGIMFLAFDGGEVIWIFSQDLAPHHEEALQLSEAAASSFRKP